MPVGSGIRFTVWLTTVCVGAALALAAYAATSTIATGIMAAALVSIVTLAVAFSLAAAIRMVNQWQRAIVLRLGKFSSVRGPGLFFITPLAETVA
jgi:regulator of protease activity HflC (stomatin/prohibitin superfamily)